MNFNHDIGLIESILQLDTTVATPFNTNIHTLEVIGTGSIILPKGTTVQRPTTPVAGMFRFNMSTTFTEYFDGTQWVTIATGGNAAALQVELDQTQVSIGLSINPDGTFNAAAFGGTTYIIAPTSVTDAIRQLDIALTANNTLAELDDVEPISPIAGHVLFYNGTKWNTAAPGAASGVQPFDPTLAALAAFNNNGLIVQTAPDTFTSRTIDGTVGNIVVTNGSGVIGNPTINLADVGIPVTTSLVRITTDVKGRVIATSAVQASDFTGVLDNVYVNATGDTITGNLVFTSGATITGIPNPVNALDVVNKQYADSIATGLDVKQSVRLSTVAPLPANTAVGSGVNKTLTGNVNGALSIDGVVVQVNNRVLIKNEAVGANNGIYDVVTVGNGTTPYVLRRSTDADNSPTGEVTAGMFTFIEEGNTLAGTGWVLATPNPITVDATSLLFTQFSESTAHVGAFGIDVVGQIIQTTATSSLRSLHNLGTTGILALTAVGTVTSRTITGTTDRLVVTNGGGVAGDPTLDISPVYVGQPSITTLGTITTGTWAGSAIGPTFGGTGLTTLGTANQFLSVNPAGTAIEYKSVVAGSGITVTPAAGTLTISVNQTVLALYRENPLAAVTPVASGVNAVSIGTGSTASSVQGFAQGNGTDARIFGQRAYANGAFATPGDAQHGVYVLRRTTTTNAVTELFLDGDAATQRLAIPNNSVFTFVVYVASRRTDATGGGAGYKFEGAIRKDTTNASLTFIGNPSRSILGETNAVWNAVLVADTITGALRVDVTGENAKTIRWVATVLTTEVTN